MTRTQAEACIEFDAGKNLVLAGFAGTGKTMLACALGIEAYRRGEIDKIMIFRSAVSSRDIGFVPGTAEEKMSVYETACRSVFNELLRRGDGYDIMKNKEIVSFESTSFLRGCTFHRALVIVEEVQNLSFQEIETVITRLHGTSRVILTGDTRQTDLRDHESGFRRMASIVSRIPQHFTQFEFEVDDIVRGPLVKAWLVASDQVYQESLLRA